MGRNETDIEQWAAEAGLDFVAVVDPNLPPADIDRVRLWIDGGHARALPWFERNWVRRADLRKLWPDVRSVVSAGVSYFVENPPEAIWNDPLRGRVARYAWGADYHAVLKHRLGQLAHRILLEFGVSAPYRIYVDSGPILEKGIAVHGGCGFFGKNTLCIHPDFGTYVFLGEILLPMELPAAWKKHEPVNLTCNGCRRCIDRCPTQALSEDGFLRVRQCISFQTIENRELIPESLRSQLGRWIFGCDECQEACPWTITRSRPGRAPFVTFDAERFAPLLSEALAWTEGEWYARYRGTPLERLGWRLFLRNALVAAGNSGQRSLADAIHNHLSSSDALIREHAEWALRRLSDGE